MNQIESPLSSFASEEYHDVVEMKYDQSEVTNRTKHSWSTMSLPQAEIGVLSDISSHSTCSYDATRNYKSFFASIMSNNK